MSYLRLNDRILQQGLGIRRVKHVLMQRGPIVSGQQELEKGSPMGHKTDLTKKIRQAVA